MSGNAKHRKPDSGIVTPDDVPMDRLEDLSGMISMRLTAGTPWP